MTPHDRRAQNLRGILMMVLAMAGFAVEDAMIKAASVTVPVGQVSLLIAVVGFAVFGVWAFRQGRGVFSRNVFSGPVIGRTLAEMVGSGGILMGLSLAPLSLVSAILQASPIMVVAAAAIFLGEEVGWRRWTAILVGFCGVLLIIKPWSTAFDPNVLWAVVGVIGMSARDIFARRMDPGVPTPVVATFGYGGVIVLSIGMMAAAGGAIMPGPVAWVQIATATLIGLVAYWAIIEATRAGDVSVITPFRYTRLIFALGLGLMLFAERPDTQTVVVAPGKGFLIGAMGVVAFCAGAVVSATVSRRFVPAFIVLGY
ncbi:MAG: DMT family transporter, partial [Pseudomonadota bacterium]